MWFALFNQQTLRDGSECVGSSLRVAMTHERRAELHQFFVKYRRAALRDVACFEVVQDGAWVVHSLRCDCLEYANEWVDEVVVCVMGVSRLDLNRRRESSWSS